MLLMRIGIFNILDKNLSYKETTCIYTVKAITYNSLMLFYMLDTMQALVFCSV